MMFVVALVGCVHQAHVIAATETATFGIEEG